MLRLIAWIFIQWTDISRRGGIWLILAMLAVTGVAGWYAAGNLKVNTDTSEMLDPALPFQKNAAELRRAFPQIKNDLVIIVKAPTLDEADAFAGALYEKLAASPKTVSAVFAPAEDPFFRKNGLLYLETSEAESRLTQLSKASSLIETLIKSPYADTLFATLADNDKLAERSDLGKETLAKIYAELADVVEASGRGETRSFSWLGALDTDAKPAEGYMRLVYATPALDFTRLQPAKPAITALRADIETLKGDFGAGRIETYITGDPALRADELASVTSGIGLSFAVSLAAVGMLLLICYRNLWMAVATLTAVIVTIVWTGAFAAFAVGQLNLISIAFTVLLTGLGVDFAIHYLLHYQERRDEGQSAKASVAGAARDTGAGLFLAALTTTLGFVSFQWTPFVGIAQLGEIAGFGILIALFVCITLTAAAMGAFPGKARPHRARKARKGPGLMDRLMTPVALATIAAGAASLLLLPKAYFDADPMSLRDPDSQSVRGFNMLFATKDTIPYRLSLILGSEEEAVAAATEAKALSTVGGARTIADFIPKDQDEKLQLVDYANATLAFAFEAEPDPVAPLLGPGARALEDRLLATYADGAPARLGAALKVLREKDDAQARALLQNNLFRFWPRMIQRVEDQVGAEAVDASSLPTPLVERYRSADGRYRVDILPKEDVRDRTALKRFVDEVSAKFPNVTGGAAQNQRAGEIISASMLQATGTALAVVAVLLILLVRRPILIVLMLLPLALASVLTIAAGVLLDIPFNYANVIVLPLLLGMGIDSGIHLVLRQQQYKQDDVVHDSATSRGVIFAALTTIASFGSLMLSDHRGTASMGQLLSIALGLSLVCTLFTLPAVFQWAERHLRPAARRKG
jgi:hypothetical protein